jgi:hypothetical protein
VPPPYGHALFNFLRYDVKLELDWLEREFGMALDPRVLRMYRRLDAAENIPALYDLGVQAAARQMQREHLELAVR